MKTRFVSLIALVTTLVALSACDAPPDAAAGARSLAAEGCTTPVCGNATVEEGEQCEPPGTAACSATCQLVVAVAPTCGDGVVNGCDEQCDPPNGTTCDAACKIIVVVPPTPTCGDGVINQASEQCEPPGTATCDASCQTIVVPPAPTCGDGVVNQASEQCDPPGAAGSYTAGCSATCQIAPTLCSTCEAGKCDALFGDATAWGCQNVTGAARTSCEALLACIRTSHCAAATNDAQACYCGSAADLACLTGHADGACKAQYEAAAGTLDAGTIASLFTDPSSAVGLADNQITCDADTSTPSCTAACPL